MRILITGANGFIGAHLAAWLAAAGHQIVGSARDARASRRRYPATVWRQADFRSHVDWQLDGIDAVINCVGVLQDGGADSTLAAHVDGARTLFDACEKARVRRVIQLSAIGADPEAGTAYAQSKYQGDRDLMARKLDWIILKPSLVVARGVYGGTALLRGLAGLPLITPVIESAARFQPIHMRDLCTVVAMLLSPDAPVRLVIEAAGPQQATLRQLVTAHRDWLGFGPSRIWVPPRWLTDLAFACGDLLGALGVRTALRSTARQQMAHDVAGDPDALLRHLGFRARPYEQALNEEPASLQDRWHARLFFVKPAARLLLAAFWIVSGLICLSSGRDEAMTLARRAGLGDLDAFAAIGGGLFDIAIGSAFLFLARYRRAVLAVMAVVTLTYLAALTWTLPELWADPLGRLTKLMPFFALLGFVAAVEDER